jgi:hypothetical protein
VARRVVDPHGVTWTIRRRWLHAPIRPRWRGPEDGGSALDLASGLDGLGPITVVVGIIALAALLAFFVLPLAVLLLEVLAFLALAGAGVLGRVLLRRPWRIEARDGDGREQTWAVAGWRDSRDAIEEIAAALAAGRGVDLPSSGPPGLP